MEVYTDDKFEAALLDKITTIVKNVMAEYQPQPGVKKEYMSQAECAKYLGVSASTLHTFILAGLKTTIIGQVYRIKRSDADSFMAKHQI